MTRLTALAVTMAALLLATAAPAPASDAEAIARHGHAQAIEALGQGTGDASLQKFAEEHLAPEYRASFGPGKLMELLAAIRTTAAMAGGVMIQGDEGAVRIRFMREGQETPVVFRQQASVPYLIVSLEMETPRASEPETRVDPITWETLVSRLDQEAKAGFSGAVCVVRAGKVVLNRGYGLADREKRVPNSEHTMFAIGSTPIDFTHAAVLKLEDTGKLKTSDLITKYLDKVPADKQTITLDHLMTGRSGLANFHHVRGVDADPDLTWIDRDTAVKRILDGKLLFAPGESRAHSHSAWVLLAAIVEIVSKESYGDFVKKKLFEPAGMTRTFLHEDLAKFPDDEIAAGYGPASFGTINSPKYWGRTSWLVMGSGGMSSTPMDLYRFISAARSSVFYSKEAAKKFGPGGGVMMGGDDRGFLCMFADKGQDMIILSSNAHTGPGDHASAVGERLAEMVLGK